ncbi:MAG: hypothetical protein Q7S40_24415 [Opitutaceae bacterium]|nr:hypothetical protein [Opitutaceae bacterium]
MNTKCGLLAALTLANSVGLVAAPEIPAAHRALYDHLDRQLTAVEGYIAKTPAPKSRPEAKTVFTGELLTASSNLGERLLEPQRLRAVELTLDRMKAIGFGGVGTRGSGPARARGRNSSISRSSPRCPKSRCSMCTFTRSAVM